MKNIYSNLKLILFSLRCFKFNLGKHGCYVVSIASHGRDLFLIQMIYFFMFEDGKLKDFIQKLL